MQQNLTSGSVFQNVVRFSLPYLLSYFLQTLYGMADLFIVGQFEPVAATTAVSIGSQVMHMLTVMLVGLAMGTSVTIAQAVGAGDEKRVARAVGNTVTLFGGISALLTVLLLLLVRRITAIMSTPAEAVDGTVRYLTICFLGIPFITAYNVLSSIISSSEPCTLAPPAPRSERRSRRPSACFSPCLPSANAASVFRCTGAI